MTEFATLNDTGDLNGNKVLVRVDFNVPIEWHNDKAVVADDYRILRSLPTIDYLRGRGAQVTLITHLGRPGGNYVHSLSVEPLRNYFSNRGLEVEIRENLRFDPGEESGDAEFSKSLAVGFDMYVNDAFSCSHRSHSSIVGITEWLPSFGGHLFVDEVQNLSQLLSTPERPFVVILGGAKVSDKIGVVEKMLTIADSILIGGGMAATFIKSLGRNIGSSPVEDARLEWCSKLLENSSKIILPVDWICAKTSKNREDNFENIRTYSGSVPDEYEIFDIGPVTVNNFCEVIRSAKTIFWNGPLGYFERPEFSEGTKSILQCVASGNMYSCIGGGDTVRAVRETGAESKISFISTGGGATLEFLAHGTLPGLEALIANRRYFQSG